MNKVLWIILGLFCLAAGIVCIVMTVMAVQFSEYGRMIFYAFIAILSSEAGILAFQKLKL